MWKTIHGVLEKNIKCTALSCIENKAMAKPKQEIGMLEALNDHFVSVGLSLAKQIDTKPENDFLKNIKSVRDQMEFKDIDDGYFQDGHCRTCRTGDSQLSI